MMRPRDHYDFGAGFEGDALADFELWDETMAVFVEVAQHDDRVLRALRLVAACYPSERLRFCDQLAELVSAQEANIA